MAATRRQPAPVTKSHVSAQPHGEFHDPTTAVPTGGSAVRGERRHDETASKQRTALVPSKPLPSLEQCIAHFGDVLPRFTNDALLDAATDIALTEIHDDRRALESIALYRRSVWEREAQSTTAQGCAMELAGAFFGLASEFATRIGKQATEGQRVSDCPAWHDLQLYVRIAVDLLGRVSP